MKYLVKFTRTETYVHEEVVEAKNKDAAIFEVEKGDWSWPDKPDYVDGGAKAYEIKDRQKGA